MRLLCNLVLEKIKYGLEGGIVSALEHLDKPNDHRRHHKHFGSLKDSLRGAYYCSLVDARRCARWISLMGFFARSGCNSAHLLIPKLS
jgi:hypothetical protein